MCEERRSQLSCGVIHYWWYYTDDQYVTSTSVVGRKCFIAPSAVPPPPPAVVFGAPTVTALWTDRHKHVRLCSSGLWRRVDLQVDASVSEKHTASIFRLTACNSTRRHSPEQHGHLHRCENSHLTTQACCLLDQHIIKSLCCGTPSGVSLFGNVSRSHCVSLSSACVS
jgi:hypothetical protein